MADHLALNQRVVVRIHDPQPVIFRSIAQPGRASALGAEGRMFKSCYSDHF